jgi:hypothetical protein
MSSRQDRVGGGVLACSFCGDVKKTKAGLVAGPGVYICHRCLANARAQGLSEGTGAPCSFCARAGRPNWGVGSPAMGRPRICDACLDMSERVLTDVQPD